MLDKIEIQILTALLRSETFMTSEELAFVTGKSSRTVRNRLKVINDYLKEYDSEIIMRPGIGIELVSDDESRIRRHVKELNRSTVIESDLRGLISLLVNHKEYLTHDEISDNLYISRSRLNKLLNELQRVLSQYDLELEAKQGYGIKVKGSELNHRRFISSYYVQETWFNDSFSEYGYLDNESEEIQVINEMVTTVLQERSYVMSTPIQRSLVIHLYIAAERIRNGQELSETKIESNHFEVEYELAAKLSENMNQLFEIEFSENEVEYIRMHLVGKKVLNETDELRISPEVNKLVDSILEEIVLLKGIDLRSDFNLRTMLGLHVVPLLSRVEYGIELKNPILDEVRSACAAGFDLALIASRVINKTYNTILSEHEISYFAMHFDISLYKKQEERNRSRVLIVCSTGRASAHLLKMKFEQNFKDYLAHIDVCDLSEVESKLGSDTYDFIFTTIPVDFELKVQVPIFEFSFFLDQNSITKIESILSSHEVSQDYKSYFSEELFFGKKNVSTREEALNYMIDQIQKTIKVPEEFKELIWERENFSGTDILDHTALPHPARLVSQNTFVAVMILDKPVLWETRFVQLVFLVSISKDDGIKYKNLLEKIVDIASSPIRLQNIVEGGTYEALIEEINLI